ncbi:MAG: hypothetical protein KDK89_13080 [Alphaproteobacteria bacterium]|nr:hypothetical protein [Alphaproteobacteria bacterium]
MSATPKRKRLSRKGLHGLLLLLCAAGFLGGLAWAPYYWQADIENQRAERELELRLIESRLTASRDQKGPPLTQDDKIDPMFVTGPTTGLAMAEFQRILSDMAGKTGMVIERQQPLQTDAGPDSTILRMDVVATGSMDALRAYLLALESGLPVIMINEAEITPKDNQQTEYPSESVRVALQVEAYGYHEAPTQ